jgi:hypothetical protein
MKALYKSLAAFQQEIPTINKNSQGYGYMFADLPTIIEKINPILKKHGLGFTQLLQGTNLETIIFHVESGECIKSLYNIPQNVVLKGMNEFQVAGSAITYFRRYALSAALGIVTDKDTDANGEPVKNTVNSGKQNEIIRMLAMANNTEELAVLWDSLDENEKTEFRPLFQKRKRTI